MICKTGIVICLLLVQQSFCQFNQCLRPAGCYLDECCFNIVPKTGEVCARIPACHEDRFPKDCCKNSRPVYTPYGRIYGYAILLDDEYSYRDDGKRYLTIWLGVQYAKPPTRENHLRFRKPMKPDRSSDNYDATYYRPACPQLNKHMKGLVNKTRNEDCLYLNIFVVNQTVGVATWRHTYPIMVFFHGGEHTYGSAARYPGHILAQLQIMVVTVQYRLNAFGFFSTNSKHAPGNYGLWDQLMALEYLHENGKSFLGDTSKVTLVGHGTGAADVALHMLSDHSGMRKPNPLFHRAIWMSGSDMMDGGFVKTDDEAFKFSYELAFRAGCSDADNTVMLECLSRRTSSELAEAASTVKLHMRNFLGRPWSPNVDGEFIKDTPKNLRYAKKFAKIPLIGGVTWNDGSDKVLETFPEIRLGNMTQKQFRQQLFRIADNDFAQDPAAVVDSIEFEYTYWPDPDNDTMRLQMYSDIYSDWIYGQGVDYSLRSQSDATSPTKNLTHMYVFKYRSKMDPFAEYMGAYHGSELKYVFGFSYFNATNWGNLGLDDPGHYYADLDRNVTDYMLYMFSNFVTHGNATPDIIRNLTWDTYRPENRTYLLIDLTADFEISFDLLQDFRVYHYAFWRYFYPNLLNMLPRFTTLKPTPLYLNQFKTATFTLSGIAAVLLIIMIALIVVYSRRRKLLR